MNSFRLRPGRRSTSPRRRGQSLVEFALILPVLLLVLGGILDFGFMLYARMTLISGTREAARWAVSQSNVLTIPTDYANSGTGHLATNMQGLVWANVSYTASCITGSGVGTCDFAAGGSPNAVKGDLIRLSTHYTYNSFVLRFVGGHVDLSSQVQMVLEVPQ